MITCLNKNKTEFEDIMKNFNGGTPKSGRMTPYISKAKKQKQINNSAMAISNLEAGKEYEGRKSMSNIRTQ